MNFNLRWSSKPPRSANLCWKCRWWLFLDCLVVVIFICTRDSKVITGAAVTATTIVVVWSQFASYQTVNNEPQNEFFPSLSTLQIVYESTSHAFIHLFILFILMNQFWRRHNNFPLSSSASNWLNSMPHWPVVRWKKMACSSYSLCSLSRSNEKRTVWVCKLNEINK